MFPPMPDPSNGFVIRVTPSNVRGVCALGHAVVMAALVTGANRSGPNGRFFRDRGEIPW